MKKMKSEERSKKRAGGRKVEVSGPTTGSNEKVRKVAVQRSDNCQAHPYKRETRGRTRVNAHVIWFLRLRPPDVVRLFVPSRWPFTAIRRIETVNIANSAI